MTNQELLVWVVRLVLASTDLVISYVLCSYDGVARKSGDLEKVVGEIVRRCDELNGKGVCQHPANEQWFNAEPKRPSTCAEDHDGTRA